MKFYECEVDGIRQITTTAVPSTPGEIEALYRGLKGHQKTLFESVCEDLPSAEDYARRNAATYGWDERFFRLARVMAPQELAMPVPYFDPPWHCFENSFRHAGQTGLRYVEGIAISPFGGPQMHAWNSTDGTDVLDYTWPFQHVNRYYGIVFDMPWMMRHSGLPGSWLAHLYHEVKNGEPNGLARSTLDRFFKDHEPVARASA